MFVKACNDLASIDTATVKAAELAIATLRSKTCRKCREKTGVHRRSGIHSRLRSVTKLPQTILADMANKGCAKCSEQRAECLECDHPGRKDKEGKVTDYLVFANVFGFDGPEMMWREYAKCQVLCKCCHLLEDSHAAAHGVDVTTLRDGNHDKWLRECKQAAPRPRRYCGRST